MYSFLIQKKINERSKIHAYSQTKRYGLNIGCRITRKLRLIEMFSPEDQKTENEVDTLLIKT